MINKKVAVYSGYVMTEGDKLFYEVRGEGIPLLMISGGGGDAGFYSFVAEILSDEYKVITYDRRGNSRSTKNDPNFEISQQARDAVAVLQAAGHESAYVFGNSGGAIIALEMAKSQHHAVKAIVVHEPPVLRILPDSEKRLRFFASLYRTIFRLGSNVAMFRFSFSTAIPRGAYSKVPKDFSIRMEKNHDFFVRHEMLPFVNYKPNVEMIKKNGVKVFVAAGKITLDKKLYYGRTAPILADMLGCEMVTFPGHHISYFDMPEEWSATLRSTLHKV